MGCRILEKERKVKREIRILKRGMDDETTNQFKMKKKQRSPRKKPTRKQENKQEKRKN